MHADMALKGAYSPGGHGVQAAAEAFPAAFENVPTSQGIGSPIEYGQ